MPASLPRSRTLAEATHTFRVGLSYALVHELNRVISQLEFTRVDHRLAPGVAEVTSQTVSDCCVCAFVRAEDMLDKVIADRQGSGETAV
jgi:hypothetical protein